MVGGNIISQMCSQLWMDTLGVQDGRLAVLEVLVHQMQFLRQRLMPKGNADVWHIRFSYILLLSLIVFRRFKGKPDSIGTNGGE